MQEGALQGTVWKMRAGGIMHFSGPLIEESHSHSLAWCTPPPLDELMVLETIG